MGDGATLEGLDAGNYDVTVEATTMTAAANSSGGRLSIDSGIKAASAIATATMGAAAARLPFRSVSEQRDGRLSHNQERAGTDACDGYDCRYDCSF